MYHLLIKRGDFMGLIGSTTTFVFKLVDSAKTIGEKTDEAIDVAEKNMSTNLLGASKEQIKKVSFKAIKEVGGATVDLIDYSINKNLQLTENYIGQQEMANLESQMEKVSSFATSISSGFTMGAAAGPIGIAIGVTAGLITWGVSQSISYNRELSNYYRQLNATNAQTQWNSARMGFIDGGRGTEN